MQCILVVVTFLFGQFLTHLYAAGTGAVEDPYQAYVKQGNEAVLVCKYNSTILDWVADSGILASGDAVTNKAKHYVSTIQNTKLYYKLHVRDSQHADEMIYRCSAGIPQQYYIQLNLYVPPSRLYFNGSTGNKLEGREGTDLHITCIAVGGKPPPDVSILDGTMPHKIQAVSYLIPMITREYHRKTIICQAMSDALDNPTTATVQIYLNLKPLTPFFNTNKVSTEETVPLRVSCTSYGSRPAATFTWIIGGNDETSSSSSAPPVTETNDTNTVTSTLTFKVDRNNDKQIIICRASNTVGSFSANKTLDVKYAPDITVDNHTYTQNDDTRIVTCNPSGNPSSYIYHGWQQKSTYGDSIREFDGNKTFKLLDALDENSYQDTGVYVCTASNGIKDKQNNLEQTGSGYITINGN